LAPNLPEVQTTRAEYLDFKGDIPGALHAYEAALRIVPNRGDILGRIAMLKADTGGSEAVLEELHKASRLDPRSPALAFETFSAYYDLGRYAEAQEAMDRALVLFPPSVGLLHEQAALYTSMGDLSRARQALVRAYRVADTNAVVAYVALREGLMWLLDDDQQRRLLTLTPADLDGGRGDWALALAETYYRRGDRAKVKAYADTAFDSYAPLLNHALSGGQRYYIQILLARIYVMGGQFEKALDLLEDLTKVTRSGVTPGYLAINPDFAPLHGNPRFERLARGS
jgi:tetratricopeptide (TPR) repeat protein